jgi:hypothetical protein
MTNDEFRMTNGELLLQWEFVLAMLDGAVWHQPAALAAKAGTSNIEHRTSNIEVQTRQDAGGTLGGRVHDWGTAL